MSDTSTPTPAPASAAPGEPLASAPAHALPEHHAASAEATPVASAAPEPAPAPAPEPAPVAATVEIRKAADIPGLSDAIKNGNKDQIIKAIKAHPEHAEDIMQLVAHENHGLVSDKTFLKSMHDAAATAESMAKDVKVVEEFIAGAGKGDKHAIEEVLRGPNGQAVIDRLTNEGRMGHLAEAGITNAEDLVQIGSKFRANVETATKRLQDTLKGADKAGPNRKKIIADDLKELISSPEGAEAYKKLSDEEKTIAKGILPEIETIISKAESLAAGLKKVRSLVTVDEGRVVVKESEEIAKLVREHGTKVLKDLSPQEQAVLRVDKVVGPVISDFENALATAGKLINKAAGGKLNPEEAAEFKKVWDTHGAHILEQHGQDKGFQQTMQKTFGEEWKTMEATAAKASGGAAKSGGFLNGIKDFFQVTDRNYGELTKQVRDKAKTAGKSATEIEELVGKIKPGNMRWGRVAIVGIPAAALTAMFVAGSGNSGPGERAASIRDQQGLGAAAGQGLA